jgi:iron complex transport system substrate-binding protein
MRTPLRLAAVLGTAACTAVLASCSSSSSSSTTSAVGATPSAAGSASASATASSGSASGAGGATASAAVSAATGAAFPVTVTAANGAVTIPAEPARIVSLDPTGTEDLYAVGAGKQVVAVDQYSDYPAGVPKTSLSGLTPNIEAIAKYNPSLVVASQDSGGLVAGLTKLGIPVLVEPAVATLNAAYAQIEQIGQATGHGAQAANVAAGMRQQIGAQVLKAGTDHKNLTYYWELSANPFYSATSSTFIGEVVGLFGLRNVADKASKPADGGYPQLSQEYIVTAKPQIIFLADNQASDGGQSPAVVARRPGWSGIPAVKDNEVIGLNDDVASRWGPRLPQLVAEIAQAVESASK